MQTVKKLVVAFDSSAGKLIESDFLIPVLHSGCICLIGLRSKNFYEKGMVVHVGKEVSIDDVMAKLKMIDGAIDDPGKQLLFVRKYFDCLSELKIGDFVSLINGDEVALVKVKREPLVKRVPLPQ